VAPSPNGVRKRWRLRCLIHRRLGRSASTSRLRYRSRYRQQLVQQRPCPLHRRQICLAAHRLKQPGLCSTWACNVCSTGAAFAQPVFSSIANVQRVSNLSIDTSPSLNTPHVSCARKWYGNTIARVRPPANRYARVAPMQRATAVSLPITHAYAALAVKQP